MKSISSLSYDYRGITLMLRYTPISIRNGFISSVISPYSLYTKIGTYMSFYYFTSDVIGLLIPFIETRKALADPNFRRISRRTGIWLLSSVT